MPATSGKPLRNDTAQADVAPHPDLDLQTHSHSRTKILRQDLDGNSP